MLRLDLVGLDDLNDRLKVNSIQEKLTNLWLDRVFDLSELTA